MDQKMEIEERGDTRRQFLQKVFSQLNAAGIRYAVLRNYEFLTNREFPVESLDTVIAEKDFEKVRTVLFQLGFHQRKPQFSLRHAAFFAFVGTKTVSFDFQLGGVHWNDMPYLGEEILSRREQRDFFFVLSPQDTAVMLLAHSILGKRFFKKKYQTQVQDILSSLNQEQILTQLSSIFPHRQAKKILSLAGQGKYGEIPISSSLVSFFLKKPSRLSVFVPLFWRWIRWKKFFSAYPLISVIGPDGAGKSTLIVAVQEHLQKRRKVSLIYCGRGKGQLMPLAGLARAYKRKERKNDASSEMEDRGAEDKKFRGNDEKLFAFRKVLYSLAAPWFIGDLALRYLFFIFPRRRTRTVVLTDRYCSDLYLMKHLPERYRSFCVKMFPRPTLTFYLSESPEVLHQRRPSESLEQLQRQLFLFAELQIFFPVTAVQRGSLEEEKKFLCNAVDAYLLKNWY